MRVLHIIPAAFNYFDDVRDKAMNLFNDQVEAGIQAEALTLQYGAVGKRQKLSAKKIAPRASFSGLYSGASIIDTFSEFDVIHLHLPILGLLKEILNWKIIHPNALLVLTYWRDPQISDFFSYFVRWYNRRHAINIYNNAQALIDLYPDLLIRSKFYKCLPDKKKIININCEIEHIKANGIHLTIDQNELKLINTDMKALACISIYDKLIYKSTYGK